MADSFRAVAPILRQMRGVSATLFAVAAIAGCGTPGAPQPPTLNLPQPVSDLQAQRTANTVQLTWTMPEQTTDKLPLKGVIQARICRQDDDGSCEPIGSRPFAAGASASFVDRLPSALLEEPPHLLIYKIEVENRSGRSAGLSDAAYAASGPEVTALTGLRAEVRADGVLLRWNPALKGSAEGAIRIERDLEEQTAKPSSAASGPNGSRPEVGEQILQVKPSTSASDPNPGRAPGLALDRQASFGQTYRYRAQREVELALAGHEIPVRGGWSDPVVVEVRDTFPPAIPAGLVSAPDTEEHAIDLSWSPDSEADLAGYVVYRRAVGANGAAVRISDPKAPVTTPSFRDSTAEPGRRYAYTVSAVDRNGNESRPSAEAVDGLPQ